MTGLSRVVSVCGDKGAARLCACGGGVSDAMSTYRLCRTLLFVCLFVCCLFACACVYSCVCWFVAWFVCLCSGSLLSWLFGW